MYEIPVGKPVIEVITNESRIIELLKIAGILTSIDELYGSPFSIQGRES